MSILDDIRACARAYELSNGLRPTCVYFGHGEILALRQWALRQWAHANRTATEPIRSNTVEVNGLKVYQVDDDDPHIRVDSGEDSPALKLADQLSMAQAEISRLRDGFMRLDTASDLQMRDGDLAREVAKEMLGGNDNWPQDHCMDCARPVPKLTR